MHTGSGAKGGSSAQSSKKRKQASVKGLPRQHSPTGLYVCATCCKLWLRPPLPRPGFRDIVVHQGTAPTGTGVGSERAC